jgi:hypothetical protein
VAQDDAHFSVDGGHVGLSSRVVHGPDRLGFQRSGSWPNDRVLVTVVSHTTSAAMALPLGVSRRLIQRLVLPATQSAEHGATRPPRSGVHHPR